MTAFRYRTGNNLGEEFPLIIRGRQMWDAIREATNGRLEVSVHPNNELGSDSAMFEELRAGTIHFFTIDGGNVPSVPVAAIQGVGFAFRNDSQAFAAFDGELGAYVRKELAADNFHAFDLMWANGMRQITSSTRPIQTPDDLEGFRIRTPPGRLWIDLFKTLGAYPAPIDYAQLYAALKNHDVDGQENPGTMVLGGRLFEVQKYLSVTNHMWSARWMLANLDAWNALPADIQDVVTRNMRKYTLLQRADVARLEDAAAAGLVQEGMIVNSPDTSAFRARLHDYYRRRRAEFGSTAWTLLEDHSQKLG